MSVSGRPRSLRVAANADSRPPGSWCEPAAWRASGTCLELPPPVPSVCNRSKALWGRHSGVRSEPGHHTILLLHVNQEMGSNGIVL